MVYRSLGKPSCIPVYKAFALQISQCCAELVGVQDERGQVQTVLPHLQE